MCVCVCVLDRVIGWSACRIRFHLLCDTMSALSLPFWIKMIQNVLFFCHFISLRRYLLFHYVFSMFLLSFSTHTRTQIKHEKQMFGFSILNIYAYIRLIKFYSTATGHNDLFIDITTISLWRLFDAIHLITQTNWRVWFVPTPIFIPIPIHTRACTVTYCRLILFVSSLFSVSVSVSALFVYFISLLTSKWHRTRSYFHPSL